MHGAASAAEDEPSHDFTAIPAPHASALHAALASFLTVAIHTLLHHRRLYPPTSFLLARAYRLPVHQSRHPAVCAWVRDAVAAASAQLRAGTVRSLAFVLHLPKSAAILERWLFDFTSVPPCAVVAGGADEVRDAEEPDGVVNWADVHEALRGALRRLSTAAENAPPPPEGCTFTLTVELRDGALPPIEHPQLWIASEPDLQPPTTFTPNTGSALGGRVTVPVRSVQAGPLYFECWHEQNEPSPSPSKLADTQDSSKSRRAENSSS